MKSKIRELGMNLDSHSPSLRLLEQELVALRDTLSELVSASSVLREFGLVWNRIGLNSSQRQVRRETITIHINNLLKDILQEEQELEKSMISSLQENESELAALCEALGLPVEKVSLGATGDCAYH